MNDRLIAALGSSSREHSHSAAAEASAFEAENRPVFVIDRDGGWHYRGTPIKRLSLVKLFASVLRRDPDGSYWLVTPVERVPVAVLDAPFVAVELSASGAGPEQVLRFRTNLDDTVTADASHPLRVTIDPETEEPRPYLMVHEGLEARLSRPVFYELVELGVFGAPHAPSDFGVWSTGKFFPIGGLTEPT